MATKESGTQDAHEEHRVDYGQRLLPTLIDEIARTDPDREFAIIPKTARPGVGYIEISFLRFARAIDACSWWLEVELGTDTARQTIAYYGPLDLMYHIVTLAALKVGHTAYLPSHRNSPTVHAHLLDEIGCSVSLVQESTPPGLSRLPTRESMKRIVIPGLDFFLQSDNGPKYPYRKSFDEARYSPFVILHTSGSTGMPHPITVNQGTLASFDAHQLIHGLTGKPVLGTSLPRTRMLMAFPYFHMASFTLLLGLVVYYGVVVVLPPSNQPLTASLVDAIHTHANVDGCALPPSILVDIYHDKSMLSRLERLKYIFFAGGPLPPEVGNAVARITHLSTLFGSTEIGFPIQEVCDPEDWEYVRYSPFYGSVFRPIGEDDLFEQILVRRRELDLFQSIFSTYPNIAEFSTKDLYKEHPTKAGLWKFMGRTDDVIVLSNAEKFNPVDFESVICSHPAIRSALVGGHGKPQTCLLVEAAIIGMTAAENKDLLDRIWPTISEANRTCPTHARILKDFVIFADQERGVERAGKGTVQREPTLQLYQKDIDKLYEAPELPNTLPEMLVEAKDEEPVPLKEALPDIVSSCLEVDGDLAPDANLFDHGLDSIQTVSLAKKINAYSIQTNPTPQTVSPQTIYTNPSIEKLESRLENGTHHENESHETEMQIIFKEWSRSLPQAKDNPVPKLPDKSVILLTGSTGSLGSYLLNTLLSSPNIEKVYCLTRDEDGRSRQIESFQSKGLNPVFETVTFLPCDFANPTLGLEESTYQTLQQEVTHIIHNAWDVNLYHPLNTFIKPHISGVRYLIDFCASSTYNAQFLFVSTQSTSLGLPQMQDQAIPEAPSSTWESAQDMGYAQSKLIAEQLLTTAASTSGIRAVVCRVGQIAGPAVEGEKGVWSLNEWFPSLVVSSLRMGVLPRELGSMNRVDWIPVDLVARVLVELMWKGGEFLGEGEGEEVVDGREAGKSTSYLPLTAMSDTLSPSSAAADLATSSFTTSNHIPSNPSTSIPDSSTPANNDRTPSTPSPASDPTNLKTFNIINPHPTTYPSLIPTILACSPVPLQLVPLSTWLEHLRNSADTITTTAMSTAAGDIDTSNPDTCTESKPNPTPTKTSPLPALKVLSFLESFIRKEDAPKGTLSTDEAQRWSETLRGLQGVREEWVKGWMRGWVREESL